MTADLVSIGETVISGDLDLPYTLPEGGSITFRAIAIDLFGNEGPLAELIVAVVENVPPTIELIRISPASGPVPTGSPFSLKVRAADDGGISELRAAVGGAATIPLRTTTSSDEIDLVGVLPSQAMFGESIEVFAEAIDTSGESSGEQQFIVEISDATPPTVAITAPGPGSDFPAAGTVTVEVDANDNFGVSQIDYTVTGAFAANGSVGVTPQSGSQIVPVEIPIPGGTPEDGSAFTVDVTGMDDAGLTSGPDQREFRMVDLIPPSLLSVTPVDGATNSSLWREIRVEFDESLDPATVTADNVTLINGGPVAGSVELFSDDSIIVFFPEEPFTPETTYTFNLNDSIIGADGNAVPPLQSAFTVTDFGIIQPADGSQVVEGQTIAFQGGGTNPDGVREVIFSTDGLDLGTGALPDLAIDVVIPLLSELGDPPHQFGASAQLLGGTVSGSETFLTSAPANMTAFRGQVGHSFLFELAGSSAGTIWATDIYTDDSGLAKAAVHAGALRPSETGLVKVTVLGSLSSYQGTTRNGVTSLGFGSWPGSYQFEPGILRTLDLNPITLDVRPSSEDTDNDGIDNGTEVQFGLDPFRDDTAEDPDGDNLTNAQEVGLGTDPFDDDTDRDGLTDDVDPDPLVPVSGFAPVAGVAKSGSALSFDGIDDSVSIPFQALEGATDLTIEFCIRTTKTGVQSVLSGARSGQSNALLLIFQSDTLFAVRVDDSTSAEFDIPSVADGEWHAFAVVRDQAAGTTELFLDGETQGILPQSTATIDLSSGGLFLGQEQDSVGAGFDPAESLEGDLDEVRIWNTTRTTQDIRRNMLRRLSDLEPGLVGYWHMDERVGDTIYDHSINTNDGLLGNGTAAALPVWISDVKTFYCPPLFCTTEDVALGLALPGVDPDGPAVSATVTSLSANGRLYQTSDGVTKGVEITVGDLPAVVTDSQNRLIYEPVAAFRGRDTFEYFVEDAVEDSSGTPAAVHVMPDNELPVAVDDPVDAFENSALTIPVIANDIDGDDDPIRIVAFTQPANGIVEDNGDGTLTYTPDPGFVDEDSFSYTVADMEVWERSLDYDDGATNLSFQGNPNDDHYGFPVWRNDYVSRGGSIVDPTPWYDQRGALMIWDTDFAGFSARWARSDNRNPIVFATGSRVTFGSPGLALIRWISPYDAFSVDIVGELLTEWDNGSGPVDVDVVIALYDQSAGTTQDLLVATLSKPTADTSNEFASTPVDLRGVSVDKGDEIIITQRERDDVAGFRLLFDDGIVILPSSATNTATVTVSVQSNTAPVTTAPPPDNALRFDGSDDYVDLGNPTPLQMTGDQTIEMWLKPFDFNARRNPWAKAYAGEGTMTQETDGTINYYYGNLGSNSGGFQTNYDALNTGVSLPLNEWTHVALVRDLSGNGKLLWYVNGDQTNEKDALFPVATAGSLNAFIGHGYTNAYSGEIDEVRVWNVARSEAEINANMLNRLNGGETGLVGYWPFEEASGGVTADLSPSGIIGTLGGGSAMAFPTRVDSFVPFENALAAMEDTDLTIALDGTDADDDPLTAVVTQLPQNGMLYETADGVNRGDPITEVATPVTDSLRRVIFAPNLNFNGLDLLSYLVNDGKVDSPEGTFYVAVEPVNDAPVAVDDEGDATVQGVPIVTQNVLTNDFDIEGDIFSIDFFDAVSANGGQVVDNGDGTFGYTTNAVFFGEDSFTYTLTDGSDTGLPATVRIIVGELGAFTFNNPSGGNWNDPANWIPNGVPGVSDRVIINVPGDYTLTVNTNVTVSVIEFGASSGTQTFQVSGGTLNIVNQGTFGTNTVFNQTGGTFTGDGEVTFMGMVSWSGGIWRGSGATTIAPGATLTVSGSGQDWYRRTLNNDGTIVFTMTGQLDAGDAATINNRAGGVIDSQSNFYFDGNDFNEGLGAVTILNNLAGGLVKKSSGGSQTFNVQFNNDGRLEVQANVLAFEQGGTSNDGTFDVRAGAELYFFRGAHVLEAGTTLTGAGHLRNQASTTFKGSYAVLGEVRLESGTLRFDSGEAITIAALVQSGGTFHGSAEVRLMGDSNWSGGIWRGSGATTVPSGVTLTVSGSGQDWYRRTLNNDGTIVFTMTGQLDAGDAATINNRAGGVIDSQSNFYFDGNDFNEGLGAVTILNNLAGGLVKKSSGGSQTFNVRMNNEGTVRVEVNQFGLQQGGTSADGVFEALNGATFVFNGGTHALQAGTTLIGAGGMEVSAASVTVEGGFTMTGGVALTVGTLHFSTAAPVDIGPLTQSGGTFHGTGEARLTGDSNWSGGIWRGSGATTVASGVTLTVSGSGQDWYRRTLNNDGTVLFTMTGQLDSGDAATINNRSGGIIDAQSVFYFDGNDFNEGQGNFTVLNNREGGLLTKSGGGNQTFNVRFFNEGTLDLQADDLDFQTTFRQTGAGAVTFLNGGSLSKSGTFTFDAGILTGAGTITGNVANNGATVRPGSNIGELSITGDYTQGASGELEMEISGDVASENFDVLSIGNTATFDGTFRLVVDGFTGTVDEIYETIIYNSRSGTFASLVDTANQNGVDYMESYLGDKLTLTVTAASASSLNSPETAKTYDKWADRIGDEESSSSSAAAAEEGNALTSIGPPGSKAWESDPLSDPDGDGRVNFHEYAFSTDPLRADSQFATEAVVTDFEGGEYITFIYLERRSPTDLRYVLQASSDLKNWRISTQSQPLARELSRRPGQAGSNTTLVRVRLLEPLGASPSLFIRVIAQPKE